MRSKKILDPNITMKKGSCKWFGGFLADVSAL